MTYGLQAITAEQQGMFLQRRLQGISERTQESFDALTQIAGIHLPC